MCSASSARRCQKSVVSLKSDARDAEIAPKSKTSISLKSVDGYANRFVWFYLTKITLWDMQSRPGSGRDRKSSGSMWDRVIDSNNLWMVPKNVVFSVYIEMTIRNLIHEAQEQCPDIVVQDACDFMVIRASKGRAFATDERLALKDSHIRRLQERQQGIDLVPAFSESKVSTKKQAAKELSKKVKTTLQDTLVSAAGDSSRMVDDTEQSSKRRRSD